MSPYAILELIVFSNDSHKATAFDYEGGDLEAMSLAQKYYRWIIQTIRPYLGKHIAEVGAGVGSFSRLLRATEPKTLTLIEPSKKTHEQLSNQLRSTKTTKVITINDYLKGHEAELTDKIDTFVYINVFEHIKDDRAELKRIAGILKSGGHAIIFVPALERLYSKFDKDIGHYRRYSKQRLRELCKAADLEVVSVRYMDMFGILPWWFSMVLLKNTKLTAQRVKLYDTFFVPVIRIFETTIQAPIGKNVLLVAKKR